MLNNLRIAKQTGVSEFSVRRALKLENPAGISVPTAAPALVTSQEVATDSSTVAMQPKMPILPEPIERTCERAQASMGFGEGCVVPVSAPVAQVPHAGLFFASPTLETMRFRSVWCFPWRVLWVRSNLA